MNSPEIKGDDPPYDCMQDSGVTEEDRKEKRVKASASIALCLLLMMTSCTKRQDTTPRSGGRGGPPQEQPRNAAKVNEHWQKDFGAFVKDFYQTAEKGELTMGLCSKYSGTPISWTLRYRGVSPMNTSGRTQLSMAAAILQGRMGKAPFQDRVEVHFDLAEHDLPGKRLDVVFCSTTSGASDWMNVPTNTSVKVSGMTMPTSDFTTETGARDGSLIIIFNTAPAN
jgi:hypothetical protein